MRTALLAALSIVPLAESLSGQTCESPASLKEVVRIGSLMGEVTLTTVTDLTVGADGNLYVGQASDESVPVFGPDGEPKPSIGRAGGGPGEFRAPPRDLSWRGDTLMTSSMMGAHVFDPEFAEVRRSYFRVRVPSESSTFMPGRPLADGSLLGYHAWNPPTSVFYRAEELPVRRFDEAGNVLSSITTVEHAMPAIGDRAFHREFENRQLFHPLGWYESSTHLPIAVTEDGTAIVYVDRGEASRRRTFDLLKIAINGDTLVRRTIPYDPIEISPAEQRTLTDAFVERFTGRAEGAEAARLRAETRRALDLGDTYPPVRGIVAGADGSIWLLRESSPRPVDRWEIYGPAGDIERTVVVREGRSREYPWAPRVQLLHVSRTEAWGVTRDDFGVPYIHRFRVAPSCGSP